jgi:hypothetical protein
MKRFLCAAIVLLSVPVAGAATPTAAVRTVAIANAPITRFAQDHGWIAWTTEKSCAERVYLRSLRTGRQVAKPIRPEARCSSSSFDGLAVAGGRAIWTTLYGAGNTEFDFAVGTMSADDPHPRTVRKMAAIAPEFGPDPIPPPVAARGRLFVFYRHEDGLLARPTHQLERLAATTPERVVSIDDPVALAVDRNRIATIQISGGPDASGQPQTHYAVWAPDGGMFSDEEIPGAPVAVALDGHYLAVLTKNAATGAKTITVARAGWGITLRTISVPPNAGAFLSASGGRAVYTGGRDVYVARLDTGATQRLTTAAGQIVGLSITGLNVYWAENVGAHGRIRIVRVPA